MGSKSGKKMENWQKLGKSGKSENRKIPGKIETNMLFFDLSLKFLSNCIILLYFV